MEWYQILDSSIAHHSQLVVEMTLYSKRLNSPLRCIVFLPFFIVVIFLTRMSVMETTVIPVDGVGGRVETIYRVVFNVHLTVYGILCVHYILVAEVIHPLDGFTAVAYMLCKVILFFTKSVIACWHFLCKTPQV